MLASVRGQRDGQELTAGTGHSQATSFGVYSAGTEGIPKPIPSPRALSVQSWRGGGGPVPCRALSLGSRQALLLPSHTSGTWMAWAELQVMPYGEVMGTREGSPLM